MKFTLLFLAAILISLVACAQISITASALTYTQDFNALDTTGTAQTALPAGWTFYEWGGSSANTTYRAGTGSSATGDTYSFGRAGSADRAIGSLASSGVPNINYGVRFVNNTGASINAMRVAFRAEQWRRGGSGNPDSVLFSFSSAAGKTVADTGASGWTTVPALLATSVTTTGSASAINGNDSFRIMTAAMPVSLYPGDTIVLRWHDFNSVGNDDAMSIDSLTVAFTNGHIPVPLNIVSLLPAPGTMAWLFGSMPIQIAFDKNITKGAAGNIYVKDLSKGITDTIAISSADVTVTGKVAGISAARLSCYAQYQVTFDSTCFDTAGNLSAGIYDTTGWRFRRNCEGVSGIQKAPMRLSVVNPASGGAFTLRFTLPKAAMVTISIYDAAGRRIARESMKAAQGDNSRSMTAPLPPGEYVIRVDSDESAGSAKATVR